MKSAKTPFTKQMPTPAIFQPNVFGSLNGSDDENYFSAQNWSSPSSPPPPASSSDPQSNVVVPNPPVVPSPDPKKLRVFNDMADYIKKNHRKFNYDVRNDAFYRSDGEMYKGSTLNSVLSRYLGESSKRTPAYGTIEKMLNKDPGLIKKLGDYWGFNDWRSP
uniref:Uncharacterized protein n=1 Tax=Panagrolaimus sp. JU765 TaxID=591449 RepID=A0AC34RIZ5_9BILA